MVSIVNKKVEHILIGCGSSFGVILANYCLARIWNNTNAKSIPTYLPFVWGVMGAYAGSIAGWTLTFPEGRVVFASAAVSFFVVKRMVYKPEKDDDENS